MQIRRMVGVGATLLCVTWIACTSSAPEDRDATVGDAARSAGTPDGIAGLPAVNEEVIPEPAPAEQVPILTGPVRHEYTGVALHQDCERLDTPAPDEPDLGGEYGCPGFDGYQVRVVTADVRSVLHLVKMGQEIHFASDPNFSEPGQFAYVTGKVVEWRYRKDEGEPRAHGLIFRIYGQDPETFKDVSHLVVARLEGTRGCVLGTTRANDEARKMADDVGLRCP